MLENIIIIVFVLIAIITFIFCILFEKEILIMPIIGFAALIVLYTAFTSFEIKTSLIEKYGENILECQYDIATLTDSTSIDGKFTLGTGTINETNVYKTYIEDENGGKKLFEFNVDRSTIYEDNLNKIDIYKPQIENKFINWLVGDKFLNLEIMRKYQVHIPEGSIISDFKIDME